MSLNDAYDANVITTDVGNPLASLTDTQIIDEFIRRILRPDARVSGPESKAAYSTSIPIPVGRCGYDANVDADIYAELRYGKIQELAVDVECHECSSD